MLPAAGDASAPHLKMFLDLADGNRAAAEDAAQQPASTDSR
jgi:hypothetical protein